MAIKVGEKDLFPYLGDYGPVSIYKGEHKIAGYKWAEKSGQELHFDNTYNSLVEVEVDGQSYQHAGSGKNLFQKKGIRLGSVNLGNGVGVTLSELTRTNRLSTKLDSYSPVKPNTKYTLSWKIGNIEVGQTDSSNAITNRGSWKSSSPFTFTTGEFTTRVHFNISKKDNSDILLEDVTDWEIQLEEGSTATEYEPPAPTPDYPIEIHSLNDFDVVSSVEKLSEGQLQEYDYDVEYENVDKINLSLSEPLRSVGDVHDRLFRDSDGLWKIERNVWETYFDGSEGWVINTGGYNINTISAKLHHPDFVKITSGATNYFDKHITSRFVNRQVYSTEDEGTMYNQSQTLYMRINKDRLTTPDLSGIKNWLGKNPLQVIYIKDNPTIETLGQELQDQLNTLKSFKDSNYVYTVLPDDDLTPTIHAKTEVKDI